MITTVFNYHEEECIYFFKHAQISEDGNSISCVFPFANETFVLTPALISSLLALPNDGPEVEQCTLGHATKIWELIKKHDIDAAYEPNFKKNDMKGEYVILADIW